MNQSIRTILGTLFLLFVLLVLVSAGGTFWGLQTQKQDALMVNLAGRQRMLTQQMVRLALEIQAGEREHIPELQESMGWFADTLTAFLEGGQAPYLPGHPVSVARVQDAAIRVQLEQVRATWMEMESALQSLLRAAPGSPEAGAAMNTVEALAASLVEQSDVAVRLFETEAAGRVERLMWIQRGFLGAALILLLAGLWLVRRSVIEPLAALDEAALRIGQGDLTSEVQPIGPREIRALAETFETMRAQLQQSRQSLLAWGQELEDRVQQRTRELEALNRVSREISSRLDLDHVLHTITDKARELLDSDVAVLCLLEEDGKLLQIQSFSGPERAITAEQSAAEDRQTREILASPSAYLCTSRGCGPACGILSPDYRSSHLVSSLQVKGRVIGALCVGAAREGGFGAEDVDLLTRLANSAAIALENARLYQQAEKLAAIEERQRIAAEMHDGLAQTLSFIRLLSERGVERLESGDLAGASQTLGRVREAAAAAVQDVRRAIASLQNQAPLPGTVADELQALLARYQNEAAARLVLECEDGCDLRLPEEQLQQVLRIGEEALRNAIRHSGAQQIRVMFRREGESFRLTISDDGCGFDPAEVPPNHFGLQIIAARAARLGGQCAVESVPGEGTRVSVRWPVDAGERVSV